MNRSAYQGLQLLVGDPYATLGGIIRVDPAGTL